MKANPYANDLANYRHFYPEWFKTADTANRMERGEAAPADVVEPPKTVELIKVKYRGALEEGVAHGLGTATFADGSVYEGTFVNGLPNGFGTYTFSEKHPFAGYTYWGEVKGGRLWGAEARMLRAGHISEGVAWSSNRVLTRWQPAARLQGKSAAQFYRGFPGMPVGCQFGDVAPQPKVEKKVEVAPPLPAQEQLRQHSRMLWLPTASAATFGLATAALGIFLIARHGPQRLLSEALPNSSEAGRTGISIGVAVGATMVASLTGFALACCVGCCIRRARKDQTHT